MEKLHPFLKIAKVKSLKDFYKKFPTDEHFFAAHPQARYGIKMAQDGTTPLTGNNPIPGAMELNVPNNNLYVPDASNISNQDIVKGLNAAGPMHIRGSYTNPQKSLSPQPGNRPGSGPGIMDTDMDVNEPDKDDSNQPAPPGGKKPKGKHSYKVSVGDKTWDPFKKDNAWNTGKGVATTDVIAGSLAMTAGAMPFQPAKKNQNVLPPAVTTGNYGYGSQASFEDGGNISPTKAREMLHNPPHGQPLSEKQRRYFGAIASGYAADGGPMITNVSPSPYTYFRPMTKTNRQKMDMPNYEGSNIPVAADGWSSGIPGTSAYQPPVTDQERQVYNNYVNAMKRQPGSYVRNWQHNQDFQKQMAQQTGFDYNRAAAIQADMKARSQSMPGSVSGIQGSDPWGGDPSWVSNREMQKAYTKYEYTHQDPKGNLYPGEAGHKEASFTPMTKEEMGNWEKSAYAKTPNQWMSNSQGIGMNAPQSEIDKLYQPGAQVADPSAWMSEEGFGSTTPTATSAQPRAKAFPTMEQAKAAHAKKKAGIETRWNATSGEYEEVGKAGKMAKATPSTDDSGPGEEAYSIDALRRTGRGSEEARYGKQIMPGMYHPDHHMEMLDAYPHKMGGMYKPYHHTYMAQGGQIPMGEQGLQVEGNQFRYLSPQTIELVGPKHENGGIDIAYNGHMVEAEGGETFHVDNNGMWSGGNMAASGTSMNAGIVGGNLYVPGTRTKFKDAFKENAEEERKASKIQDKASYFLNEYSDVNGGPVNSYRKPASNYGKVLADMYEQNKTQNELVKNTLTETQNRMLELGGMIDPENGAKKVSAMFKGKDAYNTAKWGKKIAQDGNSSNASENEIVGPKPTPITQYAWGSPNTQSFEIPGTYHSDLTYVSPRFRQSMNLPAVTTDQPPMVNGIGTQPIILEGSPESFVNKTQRLEAEAKQFAESLGKDKPKDKGKRKGMREEHFLDPSAVRDVFEQADPYQSMQVQPYLEPEYNISLQQKKNAIQSAFAPALKSAKTPAQQAAIAAQMAEQLGAVDSEEFNINQQNRAQILARNLGEMRGVRDTNLKLAMDAYEKGLGAKEAARQIRRAGEQKLTSDWRAVDALNTKLGMEEQFAGWAYDPKNKEAWEMLHDPAKFQQYIASVYNPDKNEKKKSPKTSSDKSTQDNTPSSQTSATGYYGGPIAYFGDYFPGIQRVYFAGGAVGGGMGLGAGMHGMPGHQGAMASRYSPGGDTSYYQKKKRKKKVS